MSVSRHTHTHTHRHTHTHTHTHTHIHTHTYTHIHLSGKNGLLGVGLRDHLGLLRLQALYFRLPFSKKSMPDTLPM